MAEKHFAVFPQDRGDDHVLVHAPSFAGHDRPAHARAIQGQGGAKMFPVTQAGAPLGAGETAGSFWRFAEEMQAAGSPTYETLALAVADDHDALAFLQGLPPPKRSPHLLFAAARAVLGDVPDPRSLHELVVERHDELRHVVLTRRTQVNEPARCAILLPALTALDGPLALLEVGAAAGLTLLPDVYSYDYAGHRVRGLDPEAPTLRCRPLGPVPLPRRVPEVVWRAGIDLQPLDITDDGDVAWLSYLVLTGETDRAERLRRAVAAARRRPPVVHRGDRVDPGVLILVRDRHEVLARSDPQATWIEWLGPRP